VILQFSLSRDIDGAARDVQAAINARALIFRCAAQQSDYANSTSPTSRS